MRIHPYALHFDPGPLLLSFTLESNMHKQSPFIVIAKQLFVDHPLAIFVSRWLTVYICNYVASTINVQTFRL